jgi:hypothetical protein
MSTLRRCIIHAAMEAGDNEFAAWLLSRPRVSYTTLTLYAIHYGI